MPSQRHFPRFLVALALPLCLTSMMSSLAHASISMKVKTPRGEVLDLTVHLPAGTHPMPVVVVAPGQGCNSQTGLFEDLGETGLSRGFAVFRFEWAYCNHPTPAPTTPEPSPDLANEIEDFTTVIAFAQSYSGIDPNKVILAGKSLGSLVAAKIFATMPMARALALLTPVCSYQTDENGHPLPQPQDVCAENYPSIRQDARPVLMAMGDHDPLCWLPYLYGFLKDSHGTISTVVVRGDHSLQIRDASGAIDQPKTLHNLDTISEAVFNWASDFKANN